MLKSAPREIVIGDVHGMRPELQRLLGKLQPTFDDHLIFAGDLFDKGPDGPGVAQDVRELSFAFKVTWVLGNHDWKHIRHGHKVETDATAASDDVHHLGMLGAVDRSLTPQDRVFAKQAVAWHRLAGGQLVIHGGIHETLEALPVNAAGKAPTAAEMLSPSPLSRRVRDSAAKLLYTRWVNAETGKQVRLGSERPIDPFWADRYDGRFGYAYFGHQPWPDGPRAFPHALGLDTGAVFGWGLTAAVLVDGVQVDVVSVETPERSPPGRWAAVDAA